jgi:putative flippase GtrA
MKAVKYIIFAVVSTIVNLLFQKLSNILYDGFLSLYIGMCVGTLAGLVTKYILDKKFIFYHEVETKSEDAKKFFLYTLMGVFPTIIFWGMEIGFDFLFKTENARYIGGAIGLGIGYTTKYFLDKKFVFVPKKVKA